MNDSWRKVENENGFLYYINNATNTKQWDHPAFGDIKQRLDDCNYIKYSSYRLAIKIRTLQNFLYMEEVPLSTISGIFERHKLGITEGSLCLESYDLEAVLSDIFFAVNKINHTNIDIELATELMLNFLYNVYDKDRLGKIQVISTKIILALLSNYKLNEFYQFIFNLSADHNNCITRLRLQSTLSKFIEFTKYIHETGYFGQHIINLSINDCFNNSPGLIGITESSFLLWTEKNPEIFSWVPILQRIKSSELVVHNQNCSSCIITPVIMGLRYKCTKCSNYNQCQRCFWSGCVNGKHKITHSVKEYCKENAPKGYKHIFLKKVCFLINCTKLQSDVRTRNEFIEVKSINKHSFHNLSPECTLIKEIEPLSSPHLQLQIIIKQLELQNKELYDRLLVSSKHDIKQYVDEHKLNIAALTQKLKTLKDCLIENDDTSSKTTNNASTPMTTGKTKNVSLDFFSPICRNITKIKEEDSTDVNICKDVTDNGTTVPYSINDISTWIGGKPSTTILNDLDIDASNIAIEKNRSRQTHNDLDEALAKLQQILANNFILDESLGNIDNGQLKCAVTEVEGMLTSLIDNVEIGKIQTNE